MARRFIMTAFAKDRPGLVADITKIIFENGCNLEDTEMTQLLDEFVLMLLFTGEQTGLAERISNECRRLEREKSIYAFVRELEVEAPARSESTDTHWLHVEGVDQAGIVHKISNFLAGHSVNISKLTSRKTMTAESGTPMYTVEIQIQVPKGASLDQLEQGLPDLGHEMDIEFRVENKK